MGKVRRPQLVLYLVMPAWIAELSQLRVLDLRRNRLEGEIPSELASLRFETRARFLALLPYSVQ